MSHSAADILRYAVIAGGQGTLPTDSLAWPFFVGHLPDTPDNAICAYDTGGLPDGRLMDGETIQHPGWQLRIRATDHATAWAKVALIKAALDAIANTAVAIGVSNYTLHSVTQTGTPISLGQEVSGTRRREQITVNGTLTVTTT